jgi:hypothetical protein
MDKITRAIALTLIGAIALWFLFWRKFATAPAVVVTTPSSDATPTHVILPPANPQPPPPAFVPAQTGAQIAAQVGNSILPGAGAITGPIGNEAAQDINVLTSGASTTLGKVQAATEIVFFPALVTVTAWNAISSLWSGKPLDPVSRLLITPFGNPVNHDNAVQSTGGIPSPIYAISTDGYRHHVLVDINAAGYSWREVIAMSQTYVDQFPEASQITGPNQIQIAGRPLDAASIRAAFGNDAIFKTGNSNDLHGPWELAAPAPAPIPTVVTGPGWGEQRTNPDTGTPEIWYGQWLDNSPTNDAASGG